MNICVFRSGLVVLGLACLSLAQAASDPRTIHCDQTTTVILLAGNGSIDIKNPYASGTLKTLYRQDDQFVLEGGREYAFFFNESRDGLFRFELQFRPEAPGPVWSCQVHTSAEAPFISVDHQTWSDPRAADRVTVNTTKGKPLITIQSSSKVKNPPGQPSALAGSLDPGA